MPRFVPFVTSSIGDNLAPTGIHAAAGNLEKHCRQSTEPATRPLTGQPAGQSVPQLCLHGWNVTKVRSPAVHPQLSHGRTDRFDEHEVVDTLFLRVVVRFEPEFRYQARRVLPC